MGMFLSLSTDLSSFSEMVQVLDIAKNRDTIRMLYQALVPDMGSGKCLKDLAQSYDRCIGPKSLDCITNGILI